MQIDAERVGNVADRLHKHLAYVRNCNAKDELRGFEGKAASDYFCVFDELILQQKKDFTFQGRNKRPPLDEVNRKTWESFTCIRYDGRTSSSFCRSFCIVFNK